MRQPRTSLVRLRWCKLPLIWASTIIRYSTGSPSSAPVLGRWRRKEADAARDMSQAERVRQLEKENALVKEERDILRKAVQYFAKEMGL